MTRSGGCLCGAVRYDVAGTPRESVHCHCRMCQKSAGTGFVTWTTFAKSALTYSHGVPKTYRSSKGAQREFCGTCGTQLVFRGDDADTLDVTTASMDEPDMIAPEANTWVASRRAWAHDFDTSLPDMEQEWMGGKD